MPQLEKKQERIVRTLEGPLFVSAGAGSGKTFTLTQRVLYALRPGSKPRDEWADPAVPEPFLDGIDQVLAITFTEKAAAELKERIRAGLIAEGMETEAERVDGAWISTIHGMCARIIRAHALDLGVDPGFSVAEYADDLKRRAAEHVLRRVSAEDAQGSGAYDELLGTFNLESPAAGSHDLDSLLKIVVALLARASASTEGLAAFHRVPAEPAYRELIEAYREIAEAPSYANNEAARTAVEALGAWQASAHDVAALRVCFAACGKLSLAGRGMGKDEKTAVREVRAARDRFFADAYLAAHDAALNELMALTAEVEAEYTALKRERAVLDNDDLLTLAYDALKNHEEVRREFAGRFRMVMVDEFQDTAQQQVELVRLLCSPDGRELCTVGDAQQSIYRFRGADVSVFRTKKDETERLGGTVCDLDANFRSHADILSFADRIFEGGSANRLGRDFLHLVSCGEDRRAHARVLRGTETSRRQAVLVVGGTSEERARTRAEAIAARFRRLRDEEGFTPGEMVIIMAALSRADVYAEAVRAAGMPCVVSGGTSVFRRAPEVGTVGALLNFLANPDDGETGITPLLSSPMFALGATELLALATHVDAEAGVVDSRSVTADVLLTGEIMEEFGELPLLARAREVLSRALARVGREPMSVIARDAVNESGWLWRLERGGAQEHAVAANVLRALAIVEEVEEGCALAPRLVARGFADHVAHAKESPAMLSGADGDAVRIMTIHASKGLEFPVVAVTECDGIAASRDRIQMLDEDGETLWAARPNRFDPASDKELLGDVPELDEEVLELDRVPASATEAFAYMRTKNATLDYEEAARKLYVALTRAREVAILVMGARSAGELMPGHATSLVGEVMGRILPEDPELSGAPDLGCDRLDFEGAHAGDYQLVLLDDLDFPYYPSRGAKGPQVHFAAEDYPLALSADAAADGPEEEAAERDVPLVWPAPVEANVAAPVRPERDSYSYTSLAAALHAEVEDRADASVRAADAEGAAGEEAVVRDAPARADRPTPGGEGAGDPTALGSAFHALAQWLVETGADAVPAARVDAQCRQWGVTPAQRERLETALARWERSRVRAEVLTWPELRAEVPFFVPGDPAYRDAFGPYVEGAIDLLATDPARPGEALVLDYKTGGSPAETPDALQEKHRLQAEVYARVLHDAGYDHVTLTFVRVEIPDPADPAEPETVTYHL